MKENYNDESDRKTRLNNYWRRWQSEGDQVAAALLVKEIYQKLVLFVMSYGCTKENAEDLVQEALENVFIKGRNKVIEKNISAYIYSTVKRLFFQFRRKKHLTTSTDQKLTETIPESDPDEDSNDDELLIAMKKVLNSEQYNCLYLYFWEELSYKEIAEKLGITMPMVNTFLYRAKKKLAAYLSGNSPGDSS